MSLTVNAPARDQDDADDHLGHACGHYAGHGAQRDAAERHGQRRRHLRLQPRGRHGARGRHPYADGHLHPDRHDALQHRHRLDRAGGERAGAAPKTTPTISWAAPAAITQGTALSATQLNASASVAGTFVYSPAAGTVLATGTHTLTATFTPADTTRYNTATASTVLVVNAPAPAPKTTPTLSWPAPVGHHAGHGAQRDATERQRQRGWHVRLQPRGRHGARGRHPYADGHLHPGRHDALQHRHRSTCWCPPAPRKTTPTISWATPAAITPARRSSGTQLNATASVAGTFVYGPGGRHGARRRDPYAHGHLHADEHDALQLRPPPPPASQSAPSSTS